MRSSWLASLLVSTLASAAIADERAADSNMAVARYYAGSGSHFAALNRLKSVLTNDPASAHAPEALALIGESYLALGAAPEAQTAAAVLDRKFAGSPWSVRMGAAALAPREDERSWISRALR